MTSICFGLLAPSSSFAVAISSAGKPLFGVRLRTPGLLSLLTRISRNGIGGILGGPSSLSIPTRLPSLSIPSFSILSLFINTFPPSLSPIHIALPSFTIPILSIPSSINLAPPSLSIPSLSIPSPFNLAPLSISFQSLSINSQFDQPRPIINHPTEHQRSKPGGPLAAQSQPA